MSTKIFNGITGVKEYRVNVKIHVMYSKCPESRGTTNDY